MQCGVKTVYVPKAFLDTGANHGNYIGRSLVDRLTTLNRAHIMCGLETNRRRCI